MQIKLETSNTDALSVQDASVASEPIHHGVMCEYCGDTNITGIRYRCVQCTGAFLRWCTSFGLAYDRDGCTTDCDRCSWCMANPNAWSAHQPTHQFFPIVHAGVLDAYNAVKQSLAAHTMTPTSLSHHLSGMNLDEETDKPGQVPRPFRGIVICATGLSSNERVRSMCPSPTPSLVAPLPLFSSVRVVLLRFSGRCGTPGRPSTYAASFRALPCSVHGTQI